MEAINEFLTDNRLVADHFGAEEPLAVCLKAPTPLARIRRRKPYSPEQRRSSPFRQAEALLQSKQQGVHRRRKVVKTLLEKADAIIDKNRTRILCFARAGCVFNIAYYALGCRYC